jgi:SynChlorMet cassette radical SAM/SPASM protein ScmF
MPIKQKLPDGVPPLTTFYMYITAGCNLACRHCWLTPTFEPEGSTGQCLDYDLFKIAIDEALPLGLTSIKFTGGEPLLHPDFKQMVDYASEKGIKTWMETNGTLLTQRLAKHLKQNSSMFTISVSLDGSTAATHDYLRNVPGSFNQALSGIKYLVKAGYKPQVVLSIYRDNKDEVESFIDLAVEIGCNSVKFNIIQSSGRALQMEKNKDLLTIEELIHLGNWVEKDLQKRSPIPLFYSWPRAFHGIKRLHHSQGEICNIFNILGILSSGDMAMCGIGTQEKDLIYGQLGQDDLFKVWCYHPGLDHLRQVIPDSLEGICSDCIFKRSCLGTCVAQNYHSQKRLTAPYWFCDQAERTGLFPPNRRC